MLKAELASTRYAVDVLFDLLEDVGFRWVRSMEMLSAGRTQIVGPFISLVLE